MRLSWRRPWVLKYSRFFYLGLVGSGSLQSSLQFHREFHVRNFNLRQKGSRDSSSSAVACVWLACTQSWKSVLYLMLLSIDRLFKTSVDTASCILSIAAYSTCICTPMYLIGEPIKRWHHLFVPWKEGRSHIMGHLQQGPKPWFFNCGRDSHALTRCDSAYFPRHASRWQ